MAKPDERSPLLGSGETTSSGSSWTSLGLEVEYRGPRRRLVTDVHAEEVVLKRHLTLLHAVSYIVGGVAGTGVFVSPTGVTAGVGSVGSSLVVWAAAGAFNLLLALCYAELGTALPGAAAGGDYAYVALVLGRLPAWLCLWTTVLLIAPCSGAVMARTVGEYVLELAGVACRTPLVVLIALLTVSLFAFVNSVSVRWTARLLTVFSAAKLVAFAVIIVTGLVLLAGGHTEHLETAFEGSITSPAQIAAGFVPGFVAYCGWDSVMTLAGEMKNPGRDLPLALTMSLVAVTIIYVFTILAFFTLLSPEEFMRSNAVGTSFALRALPSVPWIIPIFIAMSAFGSVNGLFLSYPRYTFAGGQDGQLPGCLALISLQYFTPIPAIILMLVLTAFFCSASFFDLQGLLLMLGVIVQIKFVLAIVALLVLKHYRPDLPRTVTVPMPVVAFCLVALIIIVAMALYQDPVTNGFGCGVFLLGIPMYYLGMLARKSPSVNRTMDKVTTFTQLYCVALPIKKDS